MQPLRVNARSQSRSKDPVTGPLSACHASRQRGRGCCLLRLKGIGPETASVLRLKAFQRIFGNRREVAAYAGLTPTPWQSGGIDSEQGISKSGNGAFAPNHGAGGLVLAAQSAGECAEPLVSRSGARRTWPSQANRHSGVGAKAAGGALEVRHPGAGTDWRRAEARESGLTADQRATHPRSGPG